MLRHSFASENSSSRHVPPTTRWGRLTGQWRLLCTHVPDPVCWGLTSQWRPPADVSQLQHAEGLDDLLASGDPLLMCPNYNMLRTTHWPVETPLQTSQLQNVEEDSLVNGDPLQTCPSYNMLRTTHWPVEIPLQMCPSYSILRMTHWPVEIPLQTFQLQHVELASGDPPADVSQLQHTEDDSLASGDPHADQALWPSAETRQDSLVCQADQTVPVVSEWQE